MWGVLVCAHANETVNARTLDENNDTSTPQARITANVFDIDKTPLRLAARRADFARPTQSPGNWNRKPPPTLHSISVHSPRPLYSQEQVFVSALSMSALCQ